MRTVTDKELAELLRSNEMVYLLDDTDEIAWGFLGDGKNRRRVVSKAKGREPFEHNPKQQNSNSMIRAYMNKDVMTKEEFENYWIWIRMTY